MKLADRQLVDGTSPRIYIGRRSGRGPRARGRYWAEWCLDGRRHYHGLRTTNREVAVRRAHEISKRYLEGLGAPKSYPITVEELVARYMERKRAEGRAPKTIQKYGFNLKYLLQWCSENDRVRAASFDESDFWSFSAQILAEGRTAKVQYDRQVLVCQLFKFGWRNRLLPEYPFTGVRLTKPGWRQQPCFTPAQVAKLLTLGTARQQAIFAVMAYLGLRIGEVRDLRWEDIRWEEGRSGMVVIRRGGSRTGAAETPKNRKERRIPLHPALRPYLLALPREDERVFRGAIDPRTGRRGVLSDSSLLQVLKRLCAKAGFANPRQYKLHSFRHTFASMCARTSVGFKYALSWLGHSDSRILDIYYQAYDDTAQQAMQSIQYSVEASGEPSEESPAGRASEAAAKAP